MILCGLGEEKIQPQNFLQAAEAGFAAAANSSKSALCLLSAESVGDRDAAWILGELSSRAAASAYKFKLGAKPDSSSLVQTDFYVDAAKDSSASIRAAIASGKAIANGIATARHLAELPPNICDPQYLANAARALARSHGITARILDEAKMRALKMNALLAVGDGSARRPRLIVMEHRGGGKSKPIVLVGKGITFDTGGISLKPSAAMDEMKFDMCGAASVFGAMRAVAEINLADEYRRHCRRRRKYAGRAAPADRATSSLQCPARRWKFSTPTPKGGLSSPTPSPTPKDTSRRQWWISPH